MIGYRRSVSAPSLMPKWKWFAATSAGLAVLLFVLAHGWYDFVPQVRTWLAAHAWVANKVSLGPLRVLDLLTLVAVVPVLTNRFGGAIEGFPLVRALANLGGHALYVFAWSIATSFVCFLFRQQWATLERPAETAWVLAVVVTLWGAAALSGTLSKSRKGRLRPSGTIPPANWANPLRNLVGVRRQAS